MKEPTPIVMDFTHYSIERGESYPLGTILPSF
mgnify:CR=1 FL=1